MKVVLVNPDGTIEHSVAPADVVATGCYRRPIAPIRPARIFDLHDPGPTTVVDYILRGRTFAGLPILMAPRYHLRERAARFHVRPDEDTHNMLREHDVWRELQDGILDGRLIDWKQEEHPHAPERRLRQYTVLYAEPDGA
jgi:hypothetical protein